MEQCKDCPQLRSLQIALDGHVENASVQIKRLVKESADYERRISALEANSQRIDERFLRVFEKLDEIIGVLRDREQRIPNLVYGIIGTAFGGALGSVIVWGLLGTR